MDAIKSLLPIDDWYIFLNIFFIYFSLLAVWAMNSVMESMLLLPVLATICTGSYISDALNSMVISLEWHTRRIQCRWVILITSIDFVSFITCHYCYYHYYCCFVSPFRPFHSNLLFFSCWFPLFFRSFSLNFRIIAEFYLRSFFPPLLD